MKALITIASLFLMILLSSCVQETVPVGDQPKTIKKVDLKKYMGQWYEIAAFPNRYQKGCRCTSAQYNMVKNKIKIHNRCIKNDDQKYSKVNGTAWVADPSNTAKLKVRFFWPFKGDYWILYVDSDYQNAIIGSPKRNYLWILSRKPEVSEETYRFLSQIAENKGYDIKKLIKTIHKNCAVTVSSKK